MPYRLSLIAQIFSLWCLLLGVAAQAQLPEVEALQSPIAEHIREQVELWRSAQPDANADSGPYKAMALFYEQRQFAPAWAQPDDLEQLLVALQGMADDGLDPEDYALSELQRQRSMLDAPSSTPRQRAHFDILATDAALVALMHLYHGKVAPATLDTHWNFDPRQFDQDQSLDAIRDALLNGTVSTLFERARPQSPLYARLRAALLKLREVATRGGWPVLADGPTLKPDSHDPRVPILRQRLRLAGYVVGEADATDDLFDPALEEALKQFQREHYLAPDGFLGKATLAALNVPIAARIEQVQANLERARWLLHELHGEFVMVDIAGYQVTYYKDAKPVWRSRVQVGKPYRRTPAFKSKITYLTLNPTWTVPPGIMRNDTLPKIRKDLGYLAANRMRVLDNQGREVSAGSVNWDDPRGIMVRQDAGPGNSLGRLVIRFPNDYLVYLHDTPHQRLFDSEQRSFSSGCIRVEHPRQLAELLLDDPDNWNLAGIDRAIETMKTQTVMLREPIPLLLAYWTVDLRDEGRISFRPDIYTRDPPLIAALAQPRAIP